MTTVTRPARPSTTAGSSAARQARISEGVVASYIHEISTRTGPGASGRSPAARGGQADRLASRPARARAVLRGHEARPRRLVQARLGV
jgi:hypothetical protein